MPSKAEPFRIPDDRLSIERRSDGSVVVRVQSEGPVGSWLPDAVFSFRCGDPQYAYWLDRLHSLEGGSAAEPRPKGGLRGPDNR